MARDPVTQSLIASRIRCLLGRHNWFLYHYCRVCGKDFTPKAAATLRRADARRERGFRMATGKALDPDHVVTTNRLDDCLKDAHVR